MLTGREPSGWASDPLDSITLEILWSRLISAVDEAAVALVRTSFSTLAREANDLAAVLLDPRGQLVAESTGAIPAFLGTVPRTVRHMLQRFPAATLQEGDVIITNDPWMGAGHLPDLVMATPIFRDDRLVAMAACVCHLPDIGGGTSLTISHREVYEEGLRIPPMKWQQAGRPNDALLELVTANVRVPDMVLGDLRAYRTANETARRRVLELMDDYELTDLGALSATIQTYSERAMREAIAAIPDGVASEETVADGMADAIVVRVTVTIRGSEILVDLAGSSGEVPAAFNVPMNYTYAMAAYALKCAIAPHVPNNEGMLRPIRVDAPPGSLFNARFPLAVGARHLAAHLIPSAVFAALASIIPERVQAGSFSPQWVGHFRSASMYEGRTWVGNMPYSGGQGASATHDGHSCLSFPGNVAAGSTEIFESLVPVRIERRELRTDSGGPGLFRGGLGQVIDVRILGDGPVRCSVWSGRRRYPAAGLFGGLPGARGGTRVNGEDVDLNAEHTIDPGADIRLLLPGGGGYGDPRQRPRDQVIRDVEEGLVSPGSAADVYGLNTQ